MKDTSVIPKGLYCYSYIDGERVVCPYWRHLTTEEGGLYQEDGYCCYLQKSDWEINEEAGMLNGWDSNNRPIIPVSAHKIKMSLLWDKCKECKINAEFNEEDYEEVQ